MAAVSAQTVKQLREKTGAGMMDCKKALTASGGDLTKASEWLRQKGIASAEKKVGRTAAEGLVSSYIHTGGRVGVLVEINCETDFVARGEEFQLLARDVAMQIAACPQVEFVTTDHIPDAVKEREKAIEMGRDDLARKPPAIQEKIVAGRIGKRLKELALLDQPFIKDTSLSVEDRVKQTSGKLGEKIVVRRFARPWGPPNSPAAPQGPDRSVLLYADRGALAGAGAETSSRASADQAGAAAQDACGPGAPQW